MNTPPTPLWRRAQDRLADTHAMQVAREWLASNAWGLLLMSEVGSGKSQAAAWLWLQLRTEALTLAQAPEVYERAKEVVWLRAPSLARLGYKGRSELLDRCACAHSLVVDEFGGEDDHQSRPLCDLLEERGDLQARTVITSNIPRAKIKERYGNRLVDRLRDGGRDERGGARWAIEVRGPSLRGLSEDEIAEAARRTAGAQKTER